MAGSVSRRDLLKGASAIAFVSAALPALAKAAPATDPLIERLIARMSIEEKAGQLSIFSDPARTDGPAINPGLAQQSMESLKAAIAAGKMTGLFNGIGVAAGRELQKTAIEQSPHGIPLIFAGDVIHGMKTTFPVPLGEAASFDPELARRTARAAAVEASAKGIHWVF
ncbi:MAG: glycoside hydrolase family 3 domain protein, partial [Sphingomonas bacterium]|uniref:glycoside hydrolase family 3 N-terminal domain-containing protein n=1 Tax=Sphingomonas bacterium TaxID=1895847 RepID=UPI0026205324